MTDPDPDDVLLAAMDRRDMQRWTERRPPPAPDSEELEPELDDDDEAEAAIDRRIWRTL